MALLAPCMVNALAFFDANLQDLMQDAAFSFANKIGVNMFYNNVSLFPIVTVQAAFFLLFRGQYNVPLRTGRQQLLPVIF